MSISYFDLRIGATAQYIQRAECIEYQHLNKKYKMEELQDWYWSADISLTGLREKISKLSISADDFTQETYNKYPLLHYICVNENVQLETVEYILDISLAWPH